MKKLSKHVEYGFTLIEMMLVAAIISGMIFMGMNYMQQRTQELTLDRAGAQMQQILNAGLSYYVNNGSWPADIPTLQAANYLPATISSPWGTPYTLTNSNSVLTVTVSLPTGMKNASALAQILAGKLPFGVSSSAAPAPSPGNPSPPSTASIAASVNIPAQNLNNIGNVSYTGVYHNGACVPVPTCPATAGSGSTVVPDIQVAPVSFSGTCDPGTTDVVYPLTSITAMASGPAVDLSSGQGPAACGNDTSQTSTACYSDATLETPLVYSVPGPSRGRVPLTTGLYWRVCLYVNTQAGEVTFDSVTGQYTSILAMTRCKISTENAGSTMNVWGY